MSRKWQAEAAAKDVLTIVRLGKGSAGGTLKNGQEASVTFGPLPPGDLKFRQQKTKPWSFPGHRSSSRTSACPGRTRFAHDCAPLTISGMPNGSRCRQSKRARRQVMALIGSVCARAVQPRLRSRTCPLLGARCPGATQPRYTTCGPTFVMVTSSP
jgi:hypothetical protein